MLLQFIIQNWFGLLILIGALVYLVYITVTHQWTKVREMAYQLMLLAERNYSDSDGNLKLDFVAALLYKNLPPWMKIFVSEKAIKELIQKWYEMAKDFLDDGIINDSVK
ncbi:MAG: hypothetical protein N2376_02480 [Clostridia bacterium]|nr:hypothetical protein [Clostridia bacterium]